MTMRQRNKIIRANIEANRASGNKEERYRWEHLLWLGMRPSMRNYSIAELEARIALVNAEHNITEVFVQTNIAK